ncbi:hypothetical protein OFC04_25475 [Escherichia coli]|nr:hypothetical protein [Escherichia coli]
MRCNRVLFLSSSVEAKANDIAILASTADGAPHLPNFDFQHVGLFEILGRSFFRDYDKEKVL